MGELALRTRDLLLSVIAAPASTRNSLYVSLHVHIYSPLSLLLLGRMRTDGVGEGFDQLSLLKPRPVLFAGAKRIIGRLCCKLK